MCLRRSENALTCDALLAPIRSIPGLSSPRLHTVPSGWISPLRGVRLRASRRLLSERAACIIVRSDACARNKATNNQQYRGDGITRKFPGQR